MNPRTVILVLAIAFVVGLGLPRVVNSQAEHLSTEIYAVPVRQTPSHYSLSVNLSWEQGRKLSFALIQVTYPDGSRFQSGQISLSPGATSISYTFNQATSFYGRSSIDFTLVEGGTLYKGRTFTQTVLKPANQDFVTAWEDQLILAFFPSTTEHLLSITSGRVLALSSGVGEAVPQNPALSEAWGEMGNYFEIHTEGAILDQILAYFRILQEDRDNSDYRISFQGDYYLGKIQGDYYTAALYGFGGGYSLVGKVGTPSPPTFTSTGRVTSSLDKGPVGGRLVQVSYFGFQPCDKGVEPLFSSETLTDQDGKWSLGNGWVGWVQLAIFETSQDPQAEIEKGCALVNSETLTWESSVMVHTRPYLKLLPPAEKAVPGQEFSIAIQVNTLGYEGLAQAWFELNFDPSALEFVGIMTDYGVISYEDEGFINQTGKIFFSTTLLPDLGEEFIPARLIFRTKQSGRTTLELVRSVVISVESYETGSQLVSLEI